MPEPIDLSQIRALTWDIGGTVFNWHDTIKDEVSALAASRGVELDPAKFTNTWRRSMFVELGKMRAGELPRTNADGLHRMVLDELAAEYPALELTPADRDALNTVWHRMRAWPDAAAALARLRERYTVVVLTVMSAAIAVDCSKHNGIDWDAIISCEFLSHYKPDAGAYLGGLQLLGVEPSQALMCAAHPGDLRAAMAAGLRSAYVPRPGERGEGKDPDLSPQPDFDINATDFTDLADQLLA
ncbi:MAG: 2-haloacid dehalogenase [Chloroflexi bacterium]|nr:MAG: 2-haloacid dehalogenase [Chloroflexota bacterium]